MPSTISIGLLVRHTIHGKALSLALNSIGYSVSFMCTTADQLMATLSPAELPRLVIMEIYGKEIRSATTLLWIKNHYPAVSVLLLIFAEKKETVTPLLINGASGYLLTGAEPSEIKIAIEAICKKGFYHPRIDENVIANNARFVKEGFNERELAYMKKHWGI